MIPSGVPVDIELILTRAAVYAEVARRGCGVDGP
jgi:hypothetical protein